MASIGFRLFGWRPLRGPNWGLFFVLKFVRSQVWGARFPQPFPKHLVTVKYLLWGTRWYKKRPQLGPCNALSAENSLVH